MGQCSNPISLSFPLSLHTVLEAGTACREENSLYASSVSDLPLAPIAAE